MSTAVQPMGELRRLDICLKAIAFATNLTEAVMLLKDVHNIDVTPVVLEGLRWQHTERYRELRAEYAPLKEGELAADELDNALIGAQVAKKALLAADKELEDGTARDPARIARDASQVKTQAIDKRQILLERPTVIHEHRDADQIARELKARFGIEVGVGPVIEGEAEEE